MNEELLKMRTLRARTSGRSPVRALGWMLLSACSSASAPAAPAMPTDPPDDTAVAPTYAELYDTYFAQGTPGHCANAGCHGDPGHNVWLCGLDKDTCYRGMMEVGLLKANDPTHSSIADPKRSELSWVNAAGGDMPLDAQGADDEASDAIKAWVAAGAQND